MAKLLGGTRIYGSATIDTNLTVGGTIGAANFSNSSVAYHAELGNGGNAGRGVTAGYSGGSYGGVGYNVVHTATSAQYTKPLADYSSYLNFNSGGFQLLTSANQTASPSSNITLAQVANISRDSILTLGPGNGTVTPSITTGNDAYTGQIQGTWSLTGTSKMQATYADLAEYYEGDQDYEVGTVLVFGGNKEVTTTTTANDRRIAGVVSATGAYIMNEKCPGAKICIALQGRVPVKVIGQVAKGDILVTSETPGYAIVNNDPKVGTVIGKAIYAKEDLGLGTVEVSIGRT